MWILGLKGLNDGEGDSYFQNEQYRFLDLTNQSNTGGPYQMEIIL